MTAPIKLEEWYATDEDVASVAPGDFAAVAPKDVVCAYAKDGVIASGSLWTLTSVLVDFAAQGAKSGMVVQLVEAASGLVGSGVCLAVDSVSGHSLVMRRIGHALNWGQPPILGGSSGIEFLISTLENQLEDVAFKLHERYALDPQIINRRPDDVYDLRVFRRLTVLETIRRQYISLYSAKAGDFKDKIDWYTREFADELNAVTVRWGPRGQQQPPTTRVSMRISR